jgi:hypothetical protein
VRRAAAWWRDEGAERCEHCLQRYHVEATVWCTGCDAHGCDACIVLVTSGAVTEWRCADCRES